MDNQNNKIEITYGSNNLKEIYNDILKDQFIKLLNDEEER